MAGGGQGVEQQVEVHKPPVGPPSPCQLGHFIVTSRRGKAESPPEVVASPDVVSRKHVMATKSPQERVFGAPAPHACEFEQDSEGTVVGLVPQRFEVELPHRHLVGEGPYGSGFSPAKPQLSQKLRIGSGQPFGGWKAGRRATAAGGGRAEALRQSVEEMDPNHEGELLTSDGVHHRLEDARKAWRPNTTESPDEHPEPLVALRQSVEASEIDAEPQGAFDDTTGFGDTVVAKRTGGASKLHAEHRRRRFLQLADTDLDWPLIHHQGAPIARTVPPVDGVVGSSPQRPHGEIKAKRGPYFDLKLAHHHQCYRPQCSMTLCGTVAPECSTSWMVANRTSCRRRRRAIPSAAGGADSSRSVVTRELSETGRVVPGPVPQVAVRSGVFGPRFEVGGGRKHAARLHLVDVLPPDDVGSPLDLAAGAEGSSHFSKDSVIDGIVMVAIVSNRASES